MSAGYAVLAGVAAGVLGVLVGLHFAFSGTDSERTRLLFLVQSLRHLDLVHEFAIDLVVVGASRLAFPAVFV